MSKRKATEKGGSSSSSKGPSTPWVDLKVRLSTQTQKERFLKLSQLILRPTKYPYFEDLQRLGIEDSFREILENAGLAGYFTGQAYRTSRRLTLEFLSTLEKVDLPDDEEGEDTHPGATFQLMNRNFSVDLAELNEALGYDPNFPVYEEGVNLRDDVVDTSGLDLAGFWSDLTGRRWEPHRAKTSEIVHPGMRVLHRCLVYHLFGKTELGNVSTPEMLPLWFGTQHRNPNLLLPINYAEQLLNRWTSLRDSTTSSLELSIGGVFTKLAFYYVPDFHNGLIDRVGTYGEERLDIGSMMNSQWLKARRTRDGTPSEDSWTWLVKGQPWLILPHPSTSVRLSESQAGNPLWIPQDMAGPAPVPLRAAEPPLPRPPRDYPPTAGAGPSGAGPSTAGSSSSGASGAYDMSALQAQMRAMQDEQRAQGVLLAGLYRMGVNQGHIEPYMNYPLWPPQEGPLPGWHNHAPTYPYHPHRPEGIDYRYPGGSDPRYDPNFPPWSSYESPPSFPPNYHDNVPPMEQTWGNAPMPPWGNYSDNPPSTMDEDSE